MNYNDYLVEVESVAQDFLDENIECYDDFDDAFDAMFCSDYVTGNGSGSYTFNSYKAQQNVKDAIFDENIVTLLDWNGINIFDTLRDRGAETLDVIIRCYILSDIYSIIEEYFKDKKGTLAEEED